MKKNFVPFKLSLRLKEFGFKDKCFGYYDLKGNLNIEVADFNENYTDWVLAPLWQQVEEFMRKKGFLFDISTVNIEGTRYLYHINLIWRDYKLSYKKARKHLFKEMIEMLEEDNIK